LDNLVTELLAMTQRREPCPERVNVPAFLAAQVAMYAEAAAARGIAVASDCAIAEAWFDPALVARIIGNLLSNAVRATPDGGRVSVSVSETGGRLRVTITDTGPGITPELHNRLFEPFVTGHPDGTGLGLAIARELSDAHGGCLRLADPGGETSGCGAVFVLELSNKPVCRPS
jgi:signal transduction histidine kinase